MTAGVVAIANQHLNAAAVAKMAEVAASSGTIEKMLDFPSLRLLPGTFAEAVQDQYPNFAAVAAIEDAAVAASKVLC